MSREEMILDDKTILTADVNWCDDSFDDELGTVDMGFSPVVENLKVMTVIDNIEHDITKAFDDKWIKYFTERFKEYLNEKAGAA